MQALPQSSQMIMAHSAHKPHSPQASPAQSGEITYVLNTGSKKFHLPSCPSVSQISEKNRQDFTGSRDALLAQGYAPCKQCEP